MAWTAAPPSWLIPTSMPVNSATICGPETKATASELMTTRSERPRSSAGPETTGPVAAVITGTCPLQRAMAAAARPHPCRAATPSRTSAPLEATKKTKGMPRCTGLVGRLGQAHAVRMGDGATAHGPEGAGDDHIAAADPPDLRRDGADDPLADVGRLLHAGSPGPNVDQGARPADGRGPRATGGRGRGERGRGGLLVVDADRRQGPERPPDFSHSARWSTVMVRSDDLHMS